MAKKPNNSTQSDNAQAIASKDIKSDPLMKVVANVSPKNFISFLTIIGTLDFFLWATISSPEPDILYFVLLVISVTSLLRDNILFQRKNILALLIKKALKYSRTTQILFVVIVLAFLILEMLTRVNFSIKFLPFAIILGIVGAVPVHRGVKRFLEQIKNNIEIKNSKIENLKYLHTQLKMSFFAFLIPSRILVFYSAISGNYSGVFIGVCIFFTLLFDDKDLYELCPKCYQRRSKVFFYETYCNNCSFYQPTNQKKQ